MPSNFNYSKPGTRGVYAIRCPLTFKTMYIGRSQNIEARFISHRNGSSSSNMKSWVREIKAKGLLPELCILEEVPKGPLGDVERKWFFHYKALGEAVFNCKTPNDETQKSPLAVIAELRAEVAGLKKAMQENSDAFLVAENTRLRERIKRMIRERMG